MARYKRNPGKPVRKRRPAKERIPPEYDEVIAIKYRRACVCYVCGYVCDLHGNELDYEDISAHDSLSVKQWRYAYTQTRWDRPCFGGKHDLRQILWIDRDTVARLGLLTVAQQKMAKRGVASRQAAEQSQSQSVDQHTQDSAEASPPV